MQKSVRRWVYSGSSPAKTAVAVCCNFNAIYFCEAWFICVGLIGHFGFMEYVKIFHLLGSDM